MTRRVELRGTHDEVDAVTEMLDHACRESADFAQAWWLSVEVFAEAMDAQIARAVHRELFESIEEP